MNADLKNFIVRDGDIILSSDGFIFYAFGYDHPQNMAISYLKYIPVELREHFPIDFIPHVWKRNERAYIRPKKLYSEENFNKIMQAFELDFPEYVFESQQLRKKVFSVPFSKIKRVFSPEDGLQQLLQKEKADELEKKALELIKLISHESGVSLENFGIHGSILTGMHGEDSDIDISIYGADNFLRVKKAIAEMVKRNVIDYLFEIPTDEYRLNKCVHDGTKFVFNATRTLKEIQNNYDLFQYEPLKQVKFHATILANSESVFRPATYEISGWEPCNEASYIDSKDIPTEVISMIGEFRGLGEIGDQIEVFGMLERVFHVKTGIKHDRVVIGSGIGEEYMKILNR
ncbi:MAG: nucleotidyltransferase domain-containing protein [Candidatus Helarchaeota archaeon]